MASIFECSFFYMGHEYFLTPSSSLQRHGHWLLFEFDRKRHEQLKRRTTGKAAFSAWFAGLATL